MLLSRDRKSLPTNVGRRKNSRGRYGHLFDPFVAPLKFGQSWSRLCSLPAGWAVERLKALSEDDLPESLIKAFLFLYELEQEVGSRFQVSSRTLGAAIGMSQSTGSRCLRKLRELGILKLYREHQIKRLGKRWIGRAAIHEVTMTHPPGSPSLEEVSQTLPPGQTSHSPGSSTLREAQSGKGEPRPRLSAGPQARS